MGSCPFHINDLFFFVNAVYDSFVEGQPEGVVACELADHPFAFIRGNGKHFEENGFQFFLQFRREGIYILQRLFFDPAFPWSILPPADYRETVG